MPATKRDLQALLKYLTFTCTSASDADAVVEAKRAMQSFIAGEWDGLAKVPR